jgi:hypothetical protein
VEILDLPTLSATECPGQLLYDKLSAIRTLRPVPGRAGRSSSRRCVGRPVVDQPSTQLDSRVAAEIQRIPPVDKPVYLLGGTGALSQAVEDQVKALGYTTVTRLAGPDRFDTALAIAIQVEQVLGGPPFVVVVATGLTSPMRSLRVQPRVLAASSSCPTTLHFPHPSVTMWSTTSRLTTLSSPPWGPAVPSYR